MNLKNISDSIRDLRKKQNLSKTDLAKVSGVSRPYISQIESGKRSPSLDVLYSLSNALDVPLIYFIEIAGYDLGTEKRDSELLLVKRKLDKIRKIIEEEME